MFWNHMAFLESYQFGINYSAGVMTRFHEFEIIITYALIEINLHNNIFRKTGE